MFPSGNVCGVSRLQRRGNVPRCSRPGTRQAAVQGPDCSRRAPGRGILGASSHFLKLRLLNPRSVHGYVCQHAFHKARSDEVREAKISLRKMALCERDAIKRHVTYWLPSNAVSLNATADGRPLQESSWERAVGKAVRPHLRGRTALSATRHWRVAGGALRSTSAAGTTAHWRFRQRPRRFEAQSAIAGRRARVPRRDSSRDHADP